MMVVLVMTLCLGDVCVEKAPFDRVESMQCAMRGQMMIADWMGQNMPPGWRLAGYRCQAGERRVGA